MINITICGHNSHHKSAFNMERPNGLTDYLLLLVKADAWFIIDAEKTIFHPNMAILFDKNTYIHYGSNSPDYNDDWIHFSFETETENILLNQLKIPFNQPLYLTQIYTLSHYVQLLAEVFHSNIPHRIQIQDLLMRTILYSLDAQLMKPSNSHKHYTAFARLRTHMYNNPADRWSVDRMATSLVLSTSYFQHLYKQFFHCSCQQDIIYARLELAKFYLSTTEMNIKSLSEFCGYENELHFMRQFKKFEGITPSDYRKLQKNNSF